MSNLWILESGSLRRHHLLLFLGTELRRFELFRNLLRLNRLLLLLLLLLLLVQILSTRFTRTCYLHLLVQLVLRGSHSTQAYFILLLTVYSVLHARHSLVLKTCVVWLSILWCSHLGANHVCMLSHIFFHPILTASRFSILGRSRAAHRWIWVCQTRSHHRNHVSLMPMLRCGLTKLVVSHFISHELDLRLPCLLVYWVLNRFLRSGQFLEWLNCTNWAVWVDVTHLMWILKLGFRLLFLKCLYDNVSEAWIPELPVLCELGQIYVIIVPTELSLGREAL